MIRILSSRLCFQSRMLNVPKTKKINPQRTIFTNDFLGVTLFTEKVEGCNNDLKAKQVDIPKMRSNTLKLYATQDPVVDLTQENGPRLISDDIRKMFYTSNTAEEVHESKDVLRKFVLMNTSNNPIIQRKAVYLFKDFVTLCHYHKMLDPAKQLFQDPEFLQKIGYIDHTTKLMGTDMPAITEIYLDLLSRQNQHQEVVNFVTELKSKIVMPPFFIVSAAMMCCLQLNTAESLKQAADILIGECFDKLIRFPWVAHPYALLACQQGNYGLAFEALSFVSKRSILKGGLMIHVLCNLDKTFDALNYLEGILREKESEDSPASATKIFFPVQSVMALTKAIEASDDKVLKLRLASCFSRLDKVASISQKTLFDLVTEDIDETRVMKYRREKNRHRIIRIATQIGEEEEESNDKDHRIEIV